MKRLLAELQIGAETVTLWEVDGLRESEDAEAIWLSSRGEIQIDSRCQGRSRWVYLIHELTHCISDTWGLKIDKEHICNTFGHAMTQALGRWLGPPPECLPAEPMDDEKTAAIERVTNRELMNNLGQRPQEED